MHAWISHVHEFQVVPLVRHPVHGGVLHHAFHHLQFRLDVRVLPFLPFSATRTSRFA